MSRRNSPLKREGLAELLGASSKLAQPLSEQSLAVTALRAGAAQPRREFNARSLQELASSIEEQGVLQPLLVRPLKDGQYEIVAGERRWRAAQLAGLSEVPVVIRPLSDEEARRAALVENLQREDLNVVDEVDAKLELVAERLGLSREAARTRLMQLLREEEGPEHERLGELFAALGESWSHFAKSKLRVLNWPAPVLEAVRSGLAYTVAGVVAAAPAEQQAELLQLALRGASREDLRARSRQLKAPPPLPPRPLRVGPQVAKLLTAQWLSSLSRAEQGEMARWFSEMPESLRAELNAKAEGTAQKAARKGDKTT